MLSARPCRGLSLFVRVPALDPRIARLPGELLKPARLAPGPRGCAADAAARGPRVARPSPLYRSSHRSPVRPGRRKDGPAMDRSGPAPPFPATWVRRGDGSEALPGGRDDEADLCSASASTLAVASGALAQDGPRPPGSGYRPTSLGQPAATIRAQSPEVGPAAAFDLPKVMPKSAGPAIPAAPGLHVRECPGHLASSRRRPVNDAGPLLTVPSADQCRAGPIIIDPPGAPCPGERTFRVERSPAQ